MIRAFARVSPHLLATALAIVVAAPALAEPALLKLGDVKGESTDKGHDKEIVIESFSWGAADEQPPVATSDPQEGGEVARALPGLTKPADVSVKRGVVGRGAPVQPAIPFQYEVTSPRDVATGQATGKRQHAPIRMTQGSVTVILPEGLCSLGAHYPSVTLRSGEQLYEMQDVTVSSCTPTATARGKRDKAKLDYMVVKMETVLISG